MDEKKIERAMDVRNDISAEVMAKSLMNLKVSTYGMYEDIACAYLAGSDEFRRGVERAVVLLTNRSLTELAEEILDKGKERDVA